jgi:monoamine oxidase
MGSLPGLTIEASAPTDLVLGEAWRTPAGRIHWADAECAPRWNGYVEGAVRSGQAAAEAVAAAVVVALCELRGQAR